MSADPSAPSPAGRLSLGALGRVNKKGLPDSLWLGAIATCAIADPGEEGLATLLAQGVGTRAALLIGLG
jgi:hypothetical protein